MTYTFKSDQLHWNKALELTPEPMHPVIPLGAVERHVKSQIWVEMVAPYIAEKSAFKSAYKRASSVGVMLLVGGGANRKARSCSRWAVRINTRVRRSYASPSIKFFAYRGWAGKSTNRMFSWFCTKKHEWSAVYVKCKWAQEYRRTFWG